MNLEILLILALIVLAVGSAAYCHRLETTITRLRRQSDALQTIAARHQTECNHLIERDLERRRREKQVAHIPVTKPAADIVQKYFQTLQPQQ